MGYLKPAYEKLKFYQNICEIRRKTYNFAQKLKKSNLRLVWQMCDAARSAKQNIREGYGKDSAAEFAHAIRISRGSLLELEGDIDDCYEDSLIPESEYKSLKNLLSFTFYLMDKYLDALYTLDKSGRWKYRFSRKQ
jgi:four helix bundle protein